MAKKIQVSDDSGVNWYTLPGSEGELTREAGQIEDTIFGQTFTSNDRGLITWSVTANAVYKGYVGYKASLKKQGSSTAFTGEAATLVSGKRYKIADATKNMWNRAVAISVFDGVTNVTAQVEAINYLFGEIVFKASYTVLDAITITGAYFPLTSLAKANSYTLTQTAAEIPTGYFDLVQSNGGYMTHDPGLRVVGLELTGIFDAAAAVSAALLTGTELIVEINPDGAGKSRARGFFRATNAGQSGDVGALEEETFSLSLNVPEGVEFPFAWAHTVDTPIPTAVRKLLNAWSNETKLDVRYLSDGITGQEGTAIVTDVSLEGSMDAMNVFSVTLLGDGVLTVV